MNKWMDRVNTVRHPLFHWNIRRVFKLERASGCLQSENSPDDGGAQRVDVRLQMRMRTKHKIGSSVETSGPGQGLVEESVPKAYILKLPTSMLEVFLFSLTLRTISVDLQRRTSSFLFTFLGVEPHPWSSKKHFNDHRIKEQVYLRCVQVTVLPNKQRIARLVQTGNTSRQPTHPFITGPTGQDGLNTRKTKAQVQRKDVALNNW